MDDWQPGDFLPGLPSADHTPPMFALKADFYPSCDTCKCECWIRWPSTARWSPNSETTRSPHLED